MAGTARSSSIPLLSPVSASADRVEQRLALLPRPRPSRGRRPPGTPRGRSNGGGAASSSASAATTVARAPGRPTPRGRPSSRQRRVRRRTRTGTRRRSGICSRRSTEPAASGTTRGEVRRAPRASGAAHPPRALEVRRARPTSRARVAGLQVVPVHPRELVGVEHARRSCPRPRCGTARASSSTGSSSSVAAGRPPEQREVVDQRLGQVSALPELAHRRRAVPLRQRAVVGPHHEREVREGRRRPSQRLVHQQLPRRVRHVVLAADHVRDLHQRVVDDDREVVGGAAVGPDDHRVADDLACERDAAAHEVLERDVVALAARGTAAPPARPRAIRSARRLRVEVAAPPGVARRLPGRERRLPLGLELLGRAEAVVRARPRQQLARRTSR